jgi:hypothetical protein
MSALTASKPENISNLLVMDQESCAFRCSGLGADRTRSARTGADHDSIVVGVCGILQAVSHTESKTWF